MRLHKRVFQYLLILSIATALIVWGSSTRHVYGCGNFWVNPATGAQECLDGAIRTNRESTPAARTGSRNEDTVSSAAVNQQYKSRRFATLPASQLRPRTPTPARLPQIVTAGTATGASNTGSSPGAATSSDNQQNQRRIVPDSYGTSGVPFSTSQVIGGTSNPAQAASYVKTGKLLMANNSDEFNSICSASLIGRSLLLTAAHCVHTYGQGDAGWVRKVRFIPAKDNGLEPYGHFDSTQFMVPNVYFKGADTCEAGAEGIVCNNDIALVALDNNSSGQQAGDLVGYYGYGWDNYSFSSPSSSFTGAFGSGVFAAITQLGYPGSHDLGLKMQMNNAYGSYVASGDLENTWLGSAMTGGSSGGPWLVNLGQDAAGADYGSASDRNVVVGVTSWGYVDGDIKLQGASSFGRNAEFPNSAYGSRGAGNIGKLVYDACDSSSGWGLANRGRCD